MNYKDYYKVLGVERNADADTIKKAFRKLARQHHPDVNKGDKKAEDRFKEINEANEVLSDPEKRKLYDQLGSDYQRYQQSGGDPRAYDWGQWFNRGGRQGAPGRQGGMSEADLGDLFEQYFGGAGMDGFTRASRGGRRARDIEQPVAIALEEAYHGASRIFSKEGQEELEVKIPPGVKTGSRVRIRGQGVAGSKGQVGDLYLVIEVEPDATYERKDDDLYRDAKVDAFTAMLGGEASVQTLAGTVVVKVPAGTSSGKMIRLRGKGMPKLSPKGEYGDLYLRVMVTVPRDLTEDEREALERIAQQRAAR